MHPISEVTPGQRACVCEAFVHSRSLQTVCSVSALSEATRSVSVTLALVEKSCTLGELASIVTARGGARARPAGRCEWSAVPLSTMSIALATPSQLLIGPVCDESTMRLIFHE